MSWYWILTIGALSALAILLYINLSLLKTLFLIARVVPYEQPGGGAGSVLVIGDSTGYGTGASRSRDSVMGRFGNDYPWYRIENDSKNGRTVSGAIEVAKNVSHQYSIIVLQIGANDLLQKKSVDSVVAEMKTLIEMLIPQAEQIIVLTSGNIGATTRFTGEQAAYFETVSRAYTDEMIVITRQHQSVSFVPLFDEPSEDPFVAEPTRYLSADGLHPSSDGYGLWYEKARPFFERIIERE
jgi:lysophospholipase L1-like esterase